MYHLRISITTKQIIYFKYARENSKTKSSIGPFIEDDGSYISENSQIAESLQKQYSEMFSNPKPEMIVDDPNSFFSNTSNNGLNEIIFNQEDIENIIKSLDPNSSSSPIDGIHPMLLKHCSNSLSYPLAMFWNKSL